MPRPLRVLTHVPLSYLRNAAERFPECEFIVIPRQGELPPDAHGEALFTTSIAAPNVADAIGRGIRWIHTLGTGIDRFSPELVGDRILTCGRGGSGVPIAEWVLAVMLAFEKDLPGSWRREPPQTWAMASLGGLCGRTLGIVGFGGIGREAARRALAFDMNVRVTRRTDAPSPIAGVHIGKLDETLASAHHLLLATPLTPRTRHLLGAAELARLPKGAHVINIARGGLIDQDALREALDSGHVARASLDVCTPEPLPAGHWLWEHPRVRLSPHVSWSMPGQAEVLGEYFLANLRRYLDDQPLEGHVDLEEGY
jgi:phosphoglycerate dehydrogenase-like enzyme